MNDCGCVDFDIAVEVKLCGELGPVPFPGGLGYSCTRPASSCSVMHAAYAGGRLLDTWPHEPALR